MIKKEELFAGIVLVAVVIAGRLLPHAWNATPVIGASIVAGWYVSKRMVVGVPLVAMLVADAILGFYEWPLMLTVYGSFVAVGLVSYALRRWKRMDVAVLTSVFGSTIFFLVTNAAVWMFTPWYDKTFAGLLHCYLLAVPFYRNGLVGDALWTMGLVLAAEMVCVLWQRDFLRAILSREDNSLSSLYVRVPLFQKISIHQTREVPAEQSHG